MKRAAFLLPVALLAVSAQPVASQTQTSALRGHDSNAPVDVAADRIEVQDRADRAVFTGNVVATQGNLTLRAPRLTVTYTNNGSAGSSAGGTGGIEIQRIDATGGVTVTSPTETAVGQYGIYDLNKRLITLIGGVTLTRGESHVQGGRLVIDLNTGRSVLDGSTVGAAPGTTSSGGRVSGRFTVPQRATGTGTSGGTASTPKTNQ